MLALRISIRCGGNWDLALTWSILHHLRLELPREALWKRQLPIQFLPMVDTGLTPSSLHLSKVPTEKLSGRINSTTPKKRYLQKDQPFLSAQFCRKPSGREQDRHWEVIMVLIWL